MNKIQKFSFSLTGMYLLAQQTVVQAENHDPANLSIEQLMASQVTSVSGTDQKFSDTAASVYIVTQEDIRRSGATNIPDALRMVPGIQVARIGVGKWAVTSRGFNGRFANKLLVLLDGRSVYTLYFGGVRWENLDLVLDDIERIEVIRGPGASIWGHNAVNGVINIITKHSEETQQGLVTVTAGNEERSIVEMRYGDQLGDNAHYRLYGKFLYRDQSVDLQGDSAADSWKQGMGGFRLDWNSHDGDRVLLEGDGYKGKTQDTLLFPTDDPLGPARRNSEPNSGTSVLARWEHDFSVASKTRTQFYYDYFNATDTEFGNEVTHTFDVDFQHDIALWEDNYFNWGVGYRIAADAFFDGKFATTRPTYKNLHLISMFVQDKAVLWDDAVHLTFGTKVQYYTLSGWNYQPSVRLLWKVHPEHHVWASFSRATRSPSRGETSLNLEPVSLPTPIPINLVLQSNPDLQADRVYNYELGYRTWVGNRFSLDLTAFYNDYDGLVTGLIGPVNFLKRQVLVTFENGATANSWGIEAVADWRPMALLRLLLSYSFLQVNVRDNINPDQRHRPRTNPANQLSFRASYDISAAVAFDAWVRYVDSFVVRDIVVGSVRNVDNYVGLDLRLAWKPVPNLELSVVGQNLNNGAHLEYIDEAFGYPRQVERSVYGKIRWTF